MFAVGSTAAVTTMEYEPGGVADSARRSDRLIPRDGDYQHNVRNHDSNAHAHLRAALIGPSESIPVVEGRLALGTWQQVVLIDFDDRPRERTGPRPCSYGEAERYTRRARPIRSGSEQGPSASYTCRSCPRRPCPPRARLSGGVPSPEARRSLKTQQHAHRDGREVVENGASRSDLPLGRARFAW